MLQPKIYPKIYQFHESFVIGQLLFDIGQRFQTYKGTAAFPLPTIADLIIGAVPLRRFRVFALTSSLPAYIVLFAQASRAKLAKLAEFRCLKHLLLVIPSLSSEFVFQFALSFSYPIA